MSNNKKNIAIKILIVVFLVALAVLVSVSRNYENTNNTAKDLSDFTEEEMLDVEKKANMTREEIAEQVKKDVKEMMEAKK